MTSSLHGLGGQGSFPVPILLALTVTSFPEPLAGYHGWGTLSQTQLSLCESNSQVHVQLLMGLSVWGVPSATWQGE